MNKQRTISFLIHVATFLIVFFLLLVVFSWVFFSNNLIKEYSRIDIHELLPVIGIPALVCSWLATKMSYWQLIVFYASVIILSLLATFFLALVQ